MKVGGVEGFREDRERMALERFGEMGVGGFLESRAWAVLQALEQNFLGLPGPGSGGMGLEQGGYWHVTIFMGVLRYSVFVTIFCYDIRSMTDDGAFGGDPGTGEFVEFVMRGREWLGWWEEV